MQPMEEQQDQYQPDRRECQRPHQKLAGKGGRLVGIISHVSELKNRIEKQIIVTKSREGGSRVEIVT